MTNKLNKGGFTLIELLVVVLIIGILSAIALPQYTKAVEKSRASEAQAYLADFVTGQALYKTANGSYATNLDDLDVTLPTNDTLKNFTIATTGSSASKAMVTLTRKNSSASYALVVEMTNNTTNGADNVLRYCTGTKQSCQSVNNGAATCATPAVSSPLWCYKGS